MIRAERCQAADVAQLMAAIPSHKTDREGRFDVQRLADHGEVFRIVDHGQAVAAYVLQGVGPVLWITAFGGRAGFDLVAALAVAVERQGRDFEAIQFRTERRGLVAKAKRHGYEVLRQDGAAYFMRKRLQ